MAQGNRLAKFVNMTSRLPKPIRTKLWNKTFGRIVPMVGTARIQYIHMQPQQVIVRMENHKSVQNHIGQMHACAMALLAETATGFITALNVPDTSIMLIKSLHIDFKRPTKGAMQAIASITNEQQQLMQNSEKGEAFISVVLTDESTEPTIQCEMLWAWVAKSQFKKK